MKLFEAIGNIFRIPDLRKRVLFLFAMLAVYRLEPPRLVAKVDAGVGPTHVASALGRLYVADTNNHRMLVCPILQDGTLDAQKTREVRLE